MRSEKPERGSVGYKRPPVERRFKKGVSGNPAGRPRKAKRSRYGAAVAELDDILLEEALRPIQIRENDQVTELPMIQAVLRSLGVSALKGHHRAQLALANMVKTVQEQRAEQNLELFKCSVEYKEEWEARIAEAKRLRQPLPDPVPHPDEMIVDLRAGKVRINGPQTPDEKAEWDHLLKIRQDHLEEIASLQAEMPKRGKLRPYYEADMEHSRKLIDMIGGVIPDEETRRKAGFDLEKWRDDNGVVVKLRAKFRSPARPKRRDRERP
jgi:hypothetical protein